MSPQHNRFVSIAPWFSISEAARAVDFYKKAFEAKETYRPENPGGLIVRLSVSGSEFWVSGNVADKGNSEPPVLGGGTIQMVLSVIEPDSFFDRAIRAGATEVFPVSEAHGGAWGESLIPSVCTGRLGTSSRKSKKLVVRQMYVQALISSTVTALSKPIQR